MTPTEIYITTTKEILWLTPIVAIVFIYLVLIAAKLAEAKTHKVSRLWQPVAVLAVFPGFLTFIFMSVSISQWFASQQMAEVINSQNVQMVSARYQYGGITAKLQVPEQVQEIEVLGTMLSVVTVPAKTTTIPTRIVDALTERNFQIAGKAS